jgi:3-oxoacyl-[acyl-carrier-protein] synthase II
MEIVVTGMGLVSALGCLETTWKHLLNGESSIQMRQPFPELAPKPLALIGTTPAELTSLTQQIVTAALQDARLEPPLLDCGIVIGSSRGNQAAWEKLIRQKAKGKRQKAEGGDSDLGVFETLRGLASLSALSPSPPLLLNWFDTLPHAAAIAAARLLGTGAPVLAPMAACATGIWAIAQGCELIRSGRCQRVIAGAVETPITPLTLVGFDQMGALAQTGAYPFDQNREGLVLGEGGAVLVLETAELAEQRSAKIYGRMLGFGLTADGYHVSAPEPGSAAAIAAVKHCLHRSRLVADQIDYIHAHGTATRLNDRNEAGLIQHLFPNQIPVSSTKGATGHTIGASGAIGTAFCLLAIQYQILPPCIGLQQPEFDLNLVTQATPASIRNALCLSFGFGGQNAAIAIATP